MCKTAIFTVVIPPIHAKRKVFPCNWHFIRDIQFGNRKVETGRGENEFTPQVAVYQREVLCVSVKNGLCNLNELIMSHPTQKGSNLKKKIRVR